ncbi:YbaY family lipoprotein [Deinococcus hopiensis]|uniref:Putative lipoprotein n=1 Tax=Deinococcus hopiensis KR-140 TaxID=695939 RepID=A0A1W1VT04_9DEIO|nr:YbaY family lipoprotein [Deinococcus hopiensis]SMB96014.1 putative lipoprotein [Deinococcus hopiensis KR-140]
MKRLTLLLTVTLLATPALAQGIRITKPSSQMGSSMSSGTVTTTTTTSATSSTMMDAPKGWRVVAGRIRAPRDVRLPAGSKVILTLEDVTVMDAPSKALLTVSFPASRLSTPYQIQFSPSRISARRTYAVMARVTDSNGRLLYITDQTHELPRAARAVLDLQVKAVR